MKFLMSFLLLGIFLFTGCDETKKVIDTAGSVQLSGNYNIVSADGKSINDEDINITFTALDKSVRGNAGCNSFFGNYSLDLYALSFSEIAATEKYCDEPTMIVERAIMDAINNTGSYTLESGTLTLLSKNDRSVLLTANKIKTNN